jgi:hypothetical protein
VPSPQDMQMHALFFSPSLHFSPWANAWESRKSEDRTRTFYELPYESRHRNQKPHVTVYE